MTIYRTWGDMPQLLGDLMTREWTGVVRAALDDQVTTASSVDRLVASIIGTVRVLRDNELFVRIIELDPELILPYLLARRGRSQDLILELTEEAIRAGQQLGEIRDGNPVAMARGLLLAAHGHVLSTHTMVDDHVTEEDLDQEFGLLLRNAITSQAVRA